MPPDPSISAVIPSFNRRATLEPSIAGLLADPAVAEVIVVDDGSDAATLEWLRGGAAAEPRLRLIEQQGKGPAHARDAGIREAVAPYVLILDDDVVPMAGLASGHVAALAGRRDVVVVGHTPSVLPAARRAGDAAEIAYARDYEKRCARWEGGAPVLGNLWGGNLSLDRERAAAIGFSSPDYEERHAVHEDRDFGLRCAAAGLTGEFHRELRGAHHYRRTVARSALDATRRAGGLVRLHAAHPGTLGPFDERAYYGVPGLAEPALRVLRREGFREPLLRVLVGGVELAGRLRLHRAADLLFKVLRRYAEHAGLERERRLGPPMLATSV